MKIMKNKRDVKSCDKFRHQVDIEDIKTPITSASNDISLINEIKRNIRSKVDEFMTDIFGDDIDYASDYSAVDVEETSDDRIRVEVRAELTYNSLEELASKLNEVVEYYDSYAYFEPVEPGIIEAYIDIDSTN